MPTMSLQEKKECRFKYLGKSCYPRNHRQANGTDISLDAVERGRSTESSGEISLRFHWSEEAASIRNGVRNGEADGRI